MMLSRRRRRLLATVWFGVFAILAVSVFFYPLSMSLRARLLFIALPGIAGAIAGHVLGESILDRERTVAYGKAILRGIGVALVAFAIFAGLYAVSLPFAEPGFWAIDQIGGLFLGTLTFGFITGGPLAIVAGGIAGASLYCLAGRRKS